MQSSSQIVIRHQQQTNTWFFTGRMPLLSLNQQCQSTEGKGVLVPSYASDNFHSRCMISYYGTEHFYFY